MRLNLDLQQESGTVICKQFSEIPWWFFRSCLPWEPQSTTRCKLPFYLSLDDHNARTKQINWNPTTILKIRLLFGK